MTVTLPVSPLRDPLPDVQSEAPLHAIALARVGVVGMRLPLVLDGGPAIVTLDAAVDLPGDQRGAHMSRFRRAVDAVASGLSPAAFAQQLARHLLELHRYARTSHVRLSAPVALGDLVIDTVATGRAGVAPVPDVAWSGPSLRLTAHGSTVCPCSFAMSGNRYAHVQRAALDVELFEPRVGARELHALLEPAFSAPVAMVLDRPGEKALVDRMFAHPRFVEDVAREAVQALVTAEAGRAAHVRATAFESIHPYDCAAVWEGTL